jgi:hypothetical protein
MKTFQRVTGGKYDAFSREQMEVKNDTDGKGFQSAYSSSKFVTS